MRTEPSIKSRRSPPTPRDKALNSSYFPKHSSQPIQRGSISARQLAGEPLLGAKTIGVTTTARSRYQVPALSGWVSFEQDALLVADLDLNDLARAKYDFDVAGHYSRPDIFRLHVNEAAMPPVVFEKNGFGSGS